MHKPELLQKIYYNKQELTYCFPFAFTDKRRDNRRIPFDIFLCLAAARLKRKTSLTDVPFTVTKTELLAKLG